MLQKASSTVGTPALQGGEHSGRTQVTEGKISHCKIPGVQCGLSSFIMEDMEHGSGGSHGLPEECMRAEQMYQASK